MNQVHNNSNYESSGEGSEVLLVVTGKTWNDLLVVISDVKLEQIDNDDYYYF